MDIKDCRVKQRIISNARRAGVITKIYDSGIVGIRFDGDCFEVERWAQEVNPVSDPCADRQQAADQTKDAEIARLKKCLKLAHEFLDKSATKINSVQDERDGWKADAERHSRNAGYWRAELTKLQNEALECKPMSEVAKIYIQVEPEKLLMSQEARRIIEYIAQCTPSSATADEVFRGLPMDKNEVLDALAEARDAGKISLVNGKYEIVRD